MATHRLPKQRQIAIIKHKQHVVGEGVSNIMEAWARHKERWAEIGMISASDSMADSSFFY